MSLMRYTLVLLAVALPRFAAADQHILYECVDQNGNKRYTNIKAESKGCKILSVGPVNTAPPAAAAKSGAKPAASSPSPANFPKVDRETQQGRDSQRRRILEQELAAEQKLLDQARKELAEQEATRLGNERNYQRVLDRIEPFQKKVKLHEDNIASLKKELSNLR